MTLPISHRYATFTLPAVMLVVQCLSLIPGDCRCSETGGDQTVAPSTCCQSNTATRSCCSVDGNDGICKCNHNGSNSGSPCKCGLGQGKETPVLPSQSAPDASVKLALSDVIQQLPKALLNLNIGRDHERQMLANSPASTSLQALFCLLQI